MEAALELYENNVCENSENSANYNSAIQVMVTK